MRSVDGSCSPLGRTAFDTDEAYLAWGRVMLDVYKTSADIKIVEAEQSVERGLRLREEALAELDRASEIAMALAMFLDANE